MLLSCKECGSDVEVGEQFLTGLTYCSQVNLEPHPYFRAAVLCGFCTESRMRWIIRREAALQKYTIEVFDCGEE